MNILKSLREKENVTQEFVADKLNVSVNSVQNWERNDKMQPETLHQLLDLYKVDKATRDSTVLSIFGRNEESEEDPVDNFPYFLFQDRPDIIKAAQEAVLSVEEMELFGYSCYVEKTYRKKYNYFDFKEFGGYFNSMKMIKDIKHKIGDYLKTINDRYYDSMFEMVYNHGINYPNTPFSFCSSSKKEIAKYIGCLPVSGRIDLSGMYEVCCNAKEPVILGTNTTYSDEARDLKFIDTDQWYGEKVYRFKESYSSYSRFLEINKVESSDPGYLQKKAQYLMDRAEYDKHPTLYDHAPEFQIRFTAYLELSELGQKYIEWYES